MEVSKLAHAPGTVGDLLAQVPAGIRQIAETEEARIREGRFQRSLSLLAGFSSVLSGLEVTYEHYRGSYSQRIMYSPVILSPLLLFAGIGGAFSRRVARTVLPLVSLATLADGLVGFIFHIRGVHRKPAGWRTPIADLIMGPPIFAPPLFAISGYLGLIASMLRREDDPEWDEQPPENQPRTPWLRLVLGWLTQKAQHLEQDAREGRLQQQLAVAAAVSATFSGIESLYSHYENNFRFKVQWSPILLTPVVAATGIGAVWSRTVARTLLPFVSLLAMLDGAIGTFYHVRGMLRRPGGLKLPLYNLIYGPPVFAPLLFAASGFLGLLASLLRRAE